MALMNLLMFATVNIDYLLNIKKKTGIYMKKDAVQCTITAII